MLSISAESPNMKEDNGSPCPDPSFMVNSCDSCELTFIVTSGLLSRSLMVLMNWVGNSNQASTLVTYFWLSMSKALVKSRKVIMSGCCVRWLRFLASSTALMFCAMLLPGRNPFCHGPLSRFAIGASLLA